MDFGRTGINRWGFLSCLPWCVLWASLPLVTAALSLEKDALLTKFFYVKVDCSGNTEAGRDEFYVCVDARQKQTRCREAGVKDSSVNP